MVARYWNRPVSVTNPAYRHMADSVGMSPPIRRRRRQTISAVDDAAGSSTVTVPRPGLVAWWSIHTSSRARCASGRRFPSRSSDAQSSVTTTSGRLGN